MAARTFSQITNDTLQQLDEVTGDSSAIAKQIVQTGINEAYSNAASMRNWKTLETNVLVPTVYGVAEYVPVTSTASITRIRRIGDVLDETNNKYITEIDRSEFQQSYPFVDPTLSQNLGNPRVWYETDYTSNRDVKIALYPIPESVLNIRVWYFFEPDPLVNDGDIPLIPDQFHYGLGYWAAAKYYEFQREFLSSYFRQLHEQWMQDMLSAEYGPVLEMPQMRPVDKTTNFITGKIGRIYND